MRAALLLFCCFIVSPANAQVQATSFWSLFNPDAWAQRALQIFVVASRTQVDIKYQNLSTNLSAGTMTMSGVELWPLPAWDEDFTCKITVARLTMSGVPVEELDYVTLTVSGFDVEIDPSCVPPDIGPASMILGTAGVKSLSVPQFRLDFDYNIPAGSLLVDASIRVQDMLSMAAVLDLSYFTVDMRTSDEPLPIVFVRGGRVELEDRGLWSLVEPILPAEMKEPAAIRGAVVPGLSQALSEANGDNPELSGAQQTFIDSVGASLSDFVNNPGRLVVEIHPGDEVALTPDDLQDPYYVFEQLAPKMARRSAVMENVLPVQLVQAALNGNIDEMTDDELSRVATALVTGVGAPRNLDAGSALALELAGRGSAESALAAAEYLQNRDPSQAYELAISAASTGSVTAAGLADQLENRLALAVVLESQNVMAESLPPDPAVSNVHELSDRAFAYVTGTKARRNYERAAFWATLSTAAGDLSGRVVMDELDGMVGARTAEDRATWAALMQSVETRAADVWLQQDIPVLIKE